MKEEWQREDRQECGSLRSQNLTRIACAQSKSPKLWSRLNEGLTRGLKWHTCSDEQRMANNLGKTQSS